MWSSMSLKSTILSNEIWRDIKGYKGYYQISNLGRIKSLQRKVPVNRKGQKTFLKTVKERILKQKTNKYGYKVVDLRRNGHDHRLVHRLVAQMFIPNPENKPVVNHLDGNKINNNATNLEWATVSENTQHSYDNMLQVMGVGEENPGSKLTEQDVLGIWELRRKGFIMKDIADKYDVSLSNISLIIRGKTWQHLKVGGANDV